MGSHDLLTAVRRLTGGSHTGTSRVGEPEPADDLDALSPNREGFSLVGATHWLNSPPLPAADLRGHVVLVNFWTYTCINWLRALPHVRAWETAYRRHGLIVIGVHSPEFSFEHDLANVRRAAEARSIDYSIAVDNLFAVWRSFGNQYWPATCLIDARGRIRHHSFGEGEYEETERVLRQLLDEAGARDLGSEPVQVDARGVEAPADWVSLRSAETYLGYNRSLGFASAPNMISDRPHTYAAPERLPFGHWALSGTWTVGREATVSLEAGARLTCRFQSRDVHLVMGRAGTEVPVPVRVRVDGRAPSADHGIDVDPSGNGIVTEPRLYQLLRRRGRITESTIEIEFFDPGVEVYAFTFG